MEQENETDVEINGRDVSDDCKNPCLPPPDEPSACMSLLENPDLFYVKLKEVHQSAGIGLVSTAASSVLDLYSFYKEVAIRGGFLQITRDGRWHEVASALDYSNRSPECAFLLQNVYSNILLQFELIHGLRTQELRSVHRGSFLVSNPQENTFSGCASSSGDDTTLKQKNPSTPCQLYIGTSADQLVEPSKEDAPIVSVSKDESKMSETAGSSLPAESKSKQIVKSAANKEKKKVQSAANKEKKKDHAAPRARRSAYQFFLSKECDRLKKKHGKNAKIRQMVVDAWKSLPEGDKLPYIEESKKDKERFNREMNAYNERKDMMENNKAEFRIFNSEQTMNEFHNEYRVPIKTEEADGLFGADGGSMIGFAAELMGNAFDLDATLQINVDDEFLSAQ